MAVWIVVVKVPGVEDKTTSPEAAQQLNKTFGIIVRPLFCISLYIICVSTSLTTHIERFSSSTIILIGRFHLHCNCVKSPYHLWCYEIRCTPCPLWLSLEHHLPHLPHRSGSLSHDTLQEDWESKRILRLAIPIH